MENRRSKRRKLMGEGREWKGGEGWGVKWDGEGRMSKYFQVARESCSSHTILDLRIQAQSYF